MAVRTFISPFDALVIRESLLRERYRGGQSFYVVPRIADLADIHSFLQSEVPELKVAVAHGQMPPGELDDIMNAFYEGSMMCCYQPRLWNPASTFRLQTR